MKYIYNKIEKIDFIVVIVIMFLVMNKMFFIYLILKIEKMFNFSCKLILWYGKLDICVFEIKLLF